jgi:hypothetical protein
LHKITVLGVVIFCWVTLGRRPETFWNWNLKGFDALMSMCCYITYSSGMMERTLSDDPVYAFFLFNTLEITDTANSLPLVFPEEGEHT